MVTIGGSVMQQAVRVPDREALVTSSRRWTWRELDDDIAHRAGSLAVAGVARGDRVAVVAANTPEWVIAYFAVARLGAIVVPVNTRLAPAELDHILADSGARLVLAGPTELERVRSATGRHGTGGPVVLDLAGPSGAPAAQAVRHDVAREDDDAMIVYTSGTTGRPKGVVHTHHSAIWAALAQITSLAMSDGERYLHLPPLYHSGGIVYLNAVSLLGGTHVLVDGFDPGVVLATIEAERVTALLAVPTMLQQLVRDPAATAHDTSSWSIGVFGAAPMPATAVTSLLETFPTVRFSQQCGQTEAGPTGICSTHEQLRARPDSSGHQAQVFVEAQVVDDDGTPVPAGAVGELCLRSEAVMTGYWNAPEATAEAIRGGWLHTGDLVEVREDGSMKLVDRRKDMIITGGRNVYSAEVEQALAQHPEVVDCAVIGSPDQEWGETVTAVVALRPGARLTLDDVRQTCAPLIADYKVPRILLVGDVPRNAAGKVQKHLLRGA